MTTAMKQLTVHTILEQLKAEGVRYVFGAASSSESPITASLHASKRNEELSLVTSLTETAATFMAMGYSQATSLPSVVNLAAGQGLLSASPAIYAARRTQVPMVILADQEDSHIFNDDPALAFDHQALVRPIAKWTAEARTAREICRLLRRAFHEAITPPKGPVVLSVPINLLLSSSKADISRPPLLSPPGAADESFVNKLVGNIKRSTSPCIIAGNEVSQFRARKELVLLSEVLGCPVYVESVPTGVNFPNRHPQFAGVLPTSIKESNEYLSKHDLFIVLGVQTRLTNRTDGPSLIPDTGMVVQINSDANLAGKSLDSNLAVQADIPQTLSRLRAELQLSVDNDWLNNAAARCRQSVISINERREKQEATMHFPDPEKPSTLRWLMRLLDGIRPDKSVIVSDIFETGALPSEMLTLESGSSYFSSNSGVDGYALGAAMGLSWSGKDLTTICLTGDQSYLSGAQALWTAARYQLDCKFVVANTRGSSRLNLLPSAPTRRLPRWLIENPAVSTTGLAESLGVRAFSATRFSELEPALLALFDKPGPALINVDVNG